MKKLIWQYNRDDQNSCPLAENRHFHVTNARARGPVGAMPAGAVLRGEHNGQKLPLLLSETPLKFLNWEPSQLSKVVQAIPVGLALLTTKHMDHCASTTSLLPWDEIMALEDWRDWLQPITKKRSHVHMTEAQAHCLRWKMVDCHLLLVLMRRQAAVFC